ncbi:MAG: ATP-dependent helicase [Bacteroidia bacterium]|nr:ATP-dependent helicase [Bacteroidia bacterium]
MLTDEQKEVIECSKHLKQNEILKINAFAGTGKTTTLIEITKANENKKYLYLAFNSSIVKEARKKFETNVDVYTLHSLAYKALEDKPKIRTNDYDMLSIQQILELSDANLSICSDIVKVLKRFCQSDANQIIEMRQYFDKAHSSVFEYAKVLWEKMEKREIEVTHDFYLKYFSMNHKALELLSDAYDGFLLDEAQDSNPVTIKIFNALQGQKILVGDKYQQIYQFRGSLNAMEMIKAKYEFFLTHTFRCSKSVVDEANKVLKNYLGAKKYLSSKREDETFEINNVAFIARTNATLIELIDNFKDEEDGINITRDVNEIFKTAINLFYFINEESNKLSKEFQYLKKFSNEDELKDYIEDYDLIELKTNLKIAKRYKTYLFTLKKEATSKISPLSNIVLTTAHASKGLEWDSVVLMKDFKDLDTVDEDKLVEEANLLYVAITRAKYEVSFLSDEDE